MESRLNFNLIIGGKNMKKLLAILTVIFVSAFFGACSNNSNYTEILKENIILAEEKTEDTTIASNEKVMEETNPQKEVEKVIDEPSSSQQPVKEDALVHEELEEPVEVEVVQKPEIVDFSEKKLIASGSTTFNPNQLNRSSNIRLAASYIDGVILMPGDEFSFNGIVGRRTSERGFLAADVFSGNSVVQGIGGGICQTSTTICIAVKQTSMKILEQNPHSQRVTYASYADEAMINYGTSDFRFVNTYEFPVTIEISFEKVSDRETIKCDIFSLE